jgi:hypothetical protein
MLCFQALPVQHYQPPTTQVRVVAPAPSGGRGSAAGQDGAAQGLTAEEDLLKGRSFRVTVPRAATPEELLLAGKGFSLNAPALQADSKDYSSRAKRIAVTFFLERHLTVGAAQTEVSALVSREVGGFGLSRVQLYADAFVAGPGRYVQARLEGCRDTGPARGRWRASLCAGFGALYDADSRRLAPRAAAGGEAEYFGGRLFSFGFYEGNVSGPPLGYFEHEHGAVLFEGRRASVVGSFGGRTANRARGKVEVGFGPITFYAFFGPRRLNQSPVTLGTRVDF